MQLHHLALRTRRLGELEGFYAGVLGLHVVRKDARSVWLRAGAVVLMLERASDDEPDIPRGSLELLAFAATDEQKRAVELGGLAEARTEFTVYLRDPDGRRVGLSTYVFPSLGE